MILIYVKNIKKLLLSIYIIISFINFLNYIILNKKNKLLNLNNFILLSFYLTLLDLQYHFQLKFGLKIN